MDANRVDAKQIPEPSWKHQQAGFEDPLRVMEGVVVEEVVVWVQNNRKVAVCYKIHHCRVVIVVAVAGMERHRNHHHNAHHGVVAVETAAAAHNRIVLLAVLDAVVVVLDAVDVVAVVAAVVVAASTVLVAKKVCTKADPGHIRELETWVDNLAQMDRTLDCAACTSDCAVRTADCVVGWMAGKSSD